MSETTTAPAPTTPKLSVVKTTSTTKKATPPPKAAPKPRAAKAATTKTPAPKKAPAKKPAAKKPAAAKSAAKPGKATRSIGRHLEQIVATGQVTKGEFYTVGQLCKMRSAEYGDAKVSSGAVANRFAVVGKEPAGWTAVPAADGKPAGAKYTG